MIRYLIFFAFTVFSFGAQAAAEELANPELAAKAMVEICIPVIAKNGDAAAFAAEKKFPELSAAEAAKFSPDAARVFGIPGLDGQGVLIVPVAAGRCSIALHKTETAKFWEAMDRLTAPGAPFTLVREKRMEEEKITKKEFRTNNEHAVFLLITAADAPRPNGIQVLMTAARKTK